MSLGIRPEDLRLVAGAVEPGSPGVIPAEVEIVEPLGYDTYVTCRTGPYRFIVRGKSSRQISMGDSVGLAVEPSRIKLFNARTGERL